MDFELRRGIPKGGKRRDGRYLARADVKSWPAVDVAEGKLENIGGEVGGDIRERRDDLMTRCAVNLIENALAALQPGFVGVR